jgi:DNA-binding transcriptional LysR family regulator
MQDHDSKDNIANNTLIRYFFFSMDSRFLESFVMVVEHGSIAEAARRLDLTAAAVAQRLRALETEIGARLVFRSGRSVRPTEAGTAILSRAADILGDVRDLKSIAVTDRPSGELRLGTSPTSTTGLLPGILALLAEKYPQIDVYMTGGIPGELYHKVLDGDLDAAIIARPPFAIPKAYDWRILREEPLVVLTRAAAPVRDPHAILASEPLIRPPHSTWAGRLIDGYLRQSGIRPRVRFEVDTFEAIPFMVDRGLGVALVHDWAPPTFKGLSLRKHPVLDNQFGRRMGFLWTRASVRIRLVQAFLEVAAMALAVGHAATPKLKSPDPRHRNRKGPKSTPM